MSRRSRRGVHVEARVQGCGRHLFLVMVGRTFYDPNAAPCERSAGEFRMDVSYFRTLLGVFLVMVVFVPTGLVFYSNAFEHSLKAMEAMDRLRPKFLLPYRLDSK